jgi:phosphohistidine phosphatase
LDLLVIRHAIAGDRDDWAQTGKPDRDRPITDEGRERMYENARGLQSLFPQIDLLASSPLTRAVQTAQIVSEAYDDAAVVEVKELVPEGAPDAAGRWLAKRQESRIAIVGHEPSLGILVGWLVRGADEPFLSLKKGGACLLRLPDEPGPGRATLKWLLPPKILRRISRT